MLYIFRHHFSSVGTQPHCYGHSEMHIRSKKMAKLAIDDIIFLWSTDAFHGILNLCELKKKHESEERFHYEAGSIESLKNLVENNFGITIIPELSTFYLTKVQKRRLRFFKTPTPVREISIATHREYIKDSLIDRLKESILEVIPHDMKNRETLNVLEI